MNRIFLISSFLLIKRRFSSFENCLFTNIESDLLIANFRIQFIVSFNYYLTSKLEPNRFSSFHQLEEQITEQGVKIVCIPDKDAESVSFARWKNGQRPASQLNLSRPQKGKSLSRWPVGKYRKVAAKKSSPRNGRTYQRVINDKANSCRGQAKSPSRGYNPVNFVAGPTPCPMASKKIPCSLFCTSPRRDVFAGINCCFGVCLRPNRASQ